MEINTKYKEMWSDNSKRKIIILSVLLLASIIINISQAVMLNCYNEGKYRNHDRKFYRSHLNNDDYRSNYYRQGAMMDEPYNMQNYNYNNQMPNNMNRQMMQYNSKNLDQSGVKEEKKALPENQNTTAPKPVEQTI